MTNTQKRPRGRPPIKNGETLRFEFRLSKERFKRYEFAAAKAGKRLAAWIKDVLDRDSR